LQLSSAKFPELRKARATESRLSGDIDALLQSKDATGEKLSDKVKFMDGRMVVPVSTSRPDMKRIGRKIGHSNSRKTAYVEPRELSGPSDALAAAEEVGVPLGSSVFIIKIGNR
jgi:hypothetical protein